MVSLGQRMGYCKSDYRMNSLQTPLLWVENLSYINVVASSLGVGVDIGLNMVSLRQR